MDRKPRVYFLGSGAIAVPVLAALRDAELVDLVGVGTQIDRPAGRKRKLQPTPVREWCLGNGMDAKQFASVNTEESLAFFRDLDPDFLLVISFGQILRQPLLDLPNKSCVNIHASLLPHYRGASPIVSALLAHDEKTGVAFMKMDAGLDTGPVYCQFEYVIEATERALELEQNLGELAGRHVQEVLLSVWSDKLVPVPQDGTAATLTRKIHKQDGQVDWTEPASTLLAKVRAYFPWPCMSFQLKTGKRELMVKITDASVVELQGSPGEVLKADKKEWVVACGDGALSINRLIPQGKKEMSGAEFLRGCHLTPGETILPST